MFNILKIYLDRFCRSFARKSQYSDEKIKIWNEIKEKKQKGLKRLDVYKEYKDLYSLSGFNKIWYK